MNADKRRIKDLPIWPHQVEGGKYVKLLQKFVDSLRDENSLQTHGNKKLFLDDVFITYLLAFFNSSIRSLRTIEDFSQTKQAQKHLSIRKICRSTLADFNTLADPQRLEPLVKALRKQVQKKQSKRTHSNDNLSQLLNRTIAVDGTFLPALANVSWAIRNSNQHGVQHHRARIDTHLRVDDGLPEAIVIPAPNQGEAQSAIENIKAGKLYLFDRGYTSLPLIAAHYDLKNPQKPIIKSEFIIRVRRESIGSIKSQTLQQNELTKKDTQAGVTSDRIVELNSQNTDRLKLQHLKLREVVIEYKQDDEVKQLKLLTNLLHLPAEVIGQLYRYRWQVELFFRWLKSYGNFRHLISQTREGMQLNLYVAIIGIMLMYLHTGYRPSKYTFVMMEMVAVGGASLEEIMPILRERERQNALARESQRRREAKRRAKKSSEDK